MENETSDYSPKLLIVFLWIITVVIAGVGGFAFGASTKPPKENVVATNPISPIPTAVQNQPVATQTPVDLESICDVSGPSQKKDYLISYILNEGDSFQSVAEKELGDIRRVSELTALNEDQRQLTVGSTIYLPPKEIKSSSGHIVEVSGKIVKKDNASWQITYGGGPTGPGILIPAYYLKDLPNLAEFSVGDCVTVLLDNGVKAYSIRKSS